MWTSKCGRLRVQTHPPQIEDHGSTGKYVSRPPCSCQRGLQEDWASLSLSSRGLERAMHRTQPAQPQVKEERRVPESHAKCVSSRKSVCTSESTKLKVSQYPLGRARQKKDSLKNLRSRPGPCSGAFESLKWVILCGRRAGERGFVSDLITLIAGRLRFCVRQHVVRFVMSGVMCQMSSARCDRDKRIAGGGVRGKAERGTPQLKSE